MPPGANITSGDDIKFGRGEVGKLNVKAKETKMLATCGKQTE